MSRDIVRTVDEKFPEFGAEVLMSLHDNDSCKERRKFLIWLLSSFGVAVTSFSVPIRKARHALNKSVYKMLPLKKLKEQDLFGPHDLAG